MSNEGIKSYSGRTCIVPLDVEDAAAIQRLEAEVRDVMDDISADEDVYVRPVNGGDAVEVRVLSENAE